MWLQLFGLAEFLRVYKVLCMPGPLGVPGALRGHSNGDHPS